MFDISTVGASVRFSKGLSLTITQFSDEGTPFESPDVDFSDNKKNLNGEMISSRTPSLYSFSVTVIPGSDDDIELTRFAQKNALQKDGIKSISTLWVDATLTIPNQNESGENITGGRKYNFINGRLKSGPVGPTSSSEGRQVSRTFTFEFERFTFDR